MTETVIIENWGGGGGGGGIGECKCLVCKLGMEGHGGSLQVSLLSALLRPKSCYVHEASQNPEPGLGFRV